MKIAIVVRNYSKSGGISRYVAELAQRYAENDEVHIFAATWKDVENSKIIFHKIPVLDFKFLKKIKKHALYNLFEVASFVMASYLKINYTDFDIVHIHGDFLGKFDIYTAHSCHKAWLDIAKKESSGTVEKLRKSIFNPLHSIILKIEKHNIRNARKIISVSVEEQKTINRYYGVSPEKIIPIPHGVDLEKFSVRNRETIREKFNFKNEDIVLIFVAHEFKRKGLLQIIEALEILKKDNLYLLVVGKDNPIPYIGLIEKYGLTDKVIFTGPVSNIQDYYSAGDIFILPASYEPFGLVILEAMACGVPVITSEKAGAAELIKDGVDGLLLRNEKNPKEIADKVKFLLDNFKERKILGDTARKTSEKYSWDNIAEKTYEVYTEINNEKRK